ncbi:DnaJ C-terminal domain-containing protein [Thauera sp.]|uniref:DnaJ C-terminal domain-containing protein n=1 Tax=Thauera sp. TaxID=1905334 RepID=UPI0039E3F5D0
MRDAYELLGLVPGASPVNIKRKFRRLAMQWHPDRNPTPAAAEHFKALRQAHDRLLAAFRTTEDGADAPSDKNETAATDDRHTSASDGPRGADRSMELELSLEEAFLGGSKQICLSRSAACMDCTGTGEVKLAFTRLCEPCRGSGRIRNGKGLQHCTACDGRGYRSIEPCSACDGSGQQQHARWLAVNLPAGLVNGDSLRLAGEGEACADPAGRSGDLHLRIRLSPHPIYTRSGRDLLLQRPISMLRLLLGGEVHLPHPAGARRIRLDAGDAAPRRIRLPGEGFPARAGRAAGDLVIDFLPMMISRAGAELRAPLEALETALQRRLSDALPELAAWEARWLPDSH